ncbi:MAG: protein kinase [Akkermansiaceae bacterium]
MSDTPFQAPSPEHLSDLLPQFDIDFFIAQGGMGAVYKGRQRSLDRDVAIKVLPKELGANEEFRESFNTEAKAMAKLNHPNLLGVFDFGSVDGMPYIVMEYVEGGSLYEASFEQAVDPEQAVAIVKGICDGLSDAHEHDIVHRDIKPANILLTEKVEPKVADFGLAQAIDSDQPGLVMGTPGYTAPEVFQDPDQAGKLADIYSVGVILHQLLTGMDPSGCMEPPSKSTGNIRLDAIWRKATNIVPTQRYATVGAMAADLGKWASAKKPSAAAAGASAYRPPVRPMQTASSGGGGMGMKIFLIALLIGGVLVTYQVLQKRKADINKKNADNAANPVIKVVEVDQDPNTGSNPTLPDPSNSSSPDPEEVVMSNPDPVVSNDPTENVDTDPEEVEPETLEPGDPELRKMAIGLINDERAKRDALLSENVRWFSFQLGVLKRDAKFDDARAIERLDKSSTKTRVADSSKVDAVPYFVAADYKTALEKEESIDQEHLSALKRIRDAYVTRLDTAASKAEDDDLKKRLKAQAERAEDLEKWVHLLSPDDPNTRNSKEEIPDEGGLGEAVEVGEPRTWLKKAAILAWTGSDQDFKRFRNDMLQKAKGTDNGRTANFAAKAACLRPIEDESVRAEVLELAKLAFESGQERPDDKGMQAFRTMLAGMAQFRCGNFSKAKATLESVDLKWPPVAQASNYYEVLCMIYEGGDENLEKARELFTNTENEMPSIPSDDQIEDKAPDKLIVWLAYKEAKALLDPKNTAAENFAGKWHNPLSDNDGNYIAHPDGRFEVVGEIWKVTWEIDDQGTLRVYWGEKPKPAIFTKDESTGNWVGTSRLGKRSMLVPGDF